MPTKYVDKFNIDGENIIIKDTALTNAVSTLQGTVSSMQSSVSNLSNEVSQIQQELNPTVKKMIVVSDSYGLGRNGAESWVTTFALSMPDYSNIYNWSDGSMGIVNVGQAGYNAEGYMRYRESEISDPENITDVVIAMGANDLLGYANFDTVFASLVSYIKVTYPNAEISLAFIGNVKQKLTVPNLNTYVNVLNCYRQACRSHTKCRYLDGVEYIMHAALFFQSDGVHPTTEGARWIGRGMAEAFRTGSYQFVARWTYEGDGLSILEEIDGPVSTIQFLAGTSKTKYFEDRQYVNYYTIPDPLLYVVEAHPVNGFLSAFDTNGDRLPLSVQYAHGEIYLSTMQTSPVTMANNSGLYGTTITLPTIVA